jgi:hypothetical protein
VAVSVVALGIIFWLSVRVFPGHVAIATMLGAGWLLMPTLLCLSLRRPMWRFGLLVPAALVSTALMAESAIAFSLSESSRVGWLLITTGVLVGGALGGWFWYHWLPVPLALIDPFAKGRWAAIGVHAALVIVGAVLVVVASSTE